MVVFTTVAAELSPVVVDLLPDPLVKYDMPKSPGMSSMNTVNENRLEMCAQESKLRVENTVSEYSKLPERFLCSNKEEVMELETLSCTQRKGVYLEEKIRLLYPNVRISCSMYDTAEFLKVQGPWESVLHVHQWLENLVDCLVLEGEAASIKGINLAMLSVCASQSEVSNNDKVSPATIHVIDQRNCSAGLMHDDPVFEKEDRVSKTKDLQTVVEGVVGYSTEDVVLQIQEMTALNEGQGDCKQSAELLSCYLCSFQTSIPNLLKMHQKTIHEKPKLSNPFRSASRPLKEAIDEGLSPNKKKRVQRKKYGRPQQPMPVPIKRPQISTECFDYGNDETDDQRLNNGSHETIYSKDECASTELPTQLNADIDHDDMDLINDQNHAPDEVPAPIEHYLPSDQIHPLIKHEPGIPAAAAFVCDSCDYMASKARNLVFHRARVHGERNLVCPICSKPYAMQKDLNQHLRFHTEHFCCDQCGKTFRSKYALSRHIAVVHENTKPKAGKSYLCNLCGRLCRSKTDYTIHCNKEHFGVHPHVCKVCEMRFFAKANLKIHMQVHAESRDFVCQECGKTFRQRQGLRVHLNIHKSERPYRCLLCEKTFTQRGALVRHMRTHTTDRPYSCKQCSAAFNDYSILRRHMLGIHKVEDTAVLRKTVKEACAVARDIERSRQTGICKTELTGFDTANTLIALSQQYHNPLLGVDTAVTPDMSLTPNMSLSTNTSKAPLTKLAFEPFTISKTFSAENFPILSLSEGTIELKDLNSVSSSSPLICFTSPSVSTASMSHVADSLGSISFQPIMADMVQYISLPYDHVNLGDTIQNSEHLQ